MFCFPFSAFTPKTLTCERIRLAVSDYNRGEYLRNDLGLRATLEAVQNLPPSLGRFVSEVCVVADWGSIPYFRFKHRVVMAGEIQTLWPLLQSMRTLRADNDWSAETTIMSIAVDVLSQTRLLEPIPDDWQSKRKKRRQLSFLSKYLHWCINDAFPIWDSRARRALSNRRNDASWPSYKEWLSQVRQEVANHRACCLEKIRLPGESLIRTLDKALYIIDDSARKSPEHPKP